MVQIIRDSTNRWWKEIIVGLSIFCVLWVMGGLSEAQGDFKVIKKDIASMLKSIEFMQADIKIALYKRYTSDDAKSDLKEVIDDAKSDFKEITSRIDKVSNDLNENEKEDIRGHIK